MHPICEFIRGHLNLAGSVVHAIVVTYFARLAVTSALFYLTLTACYFSAALPRSADELVYGLRRVERC